MLSRKTSTKKPTKKSELESVSKNDALSSTPPDTLLNIVSIDMGIKNISVCKMLWNVPGGLGSLYMPNIGNTQTSLESPESSNGIKYQTDTTLFLEILENILQFGSPWAMRLKESSNETLDKSNQSITKLKSSDLNVEKKLVPYYDSFFNHTQLSNQLDGSDTPISNNNTVTATCSANTCLHPIPAIYSWSRLDLERQFQLDHQTGSENFRETPGSFQPFGLEHIYSLANSFVHKVILDNSDLPNHVIPNVSISHKRGNSIGSKTKINDNYDEDSNINNNDAKSDISGKNKSIANENSKVLSAPKTLVLIERQRFRSSSSSNILEWTVRINRLEMALFSVLKTISQTFKQSGENRSIDVFSVPPKSVVNYWKMVYPDIGAEAGTEAGTEASTEADTEDSETDSKKGRSKKCASKDVYKLGKQVKLDIAAQILKDQNVVGLCHNNYNDINNNNNHDNGSSTSSSSVAVSGSDELVFAPANTVISSSSNFKQYPTRVSPFDTNANLNPSTNNSTTNNTSTNTRYQFSPLSKPKKTRLDGKLKADDLADSLLQGVAWCHWQANMRRLSLLVDRVNKYGVGKM